MFSHIFVGANDIDTAKTFYDAVLGALGAKPAHVDAGGRLVYVHNGGVFMVGKPINGEPACGANGGTIGFAVTSEEQAKAWHDAGVANGGTSIEDAPGVRASSGLFLAYLRDPSGNKLCALHRMPK